MVYGVDLLDLASKTWCLVRETAKYTWLVGHGLVQWVWPFQLGQ